MYDTIVSAAVLKQHLQSPQWIILDGRFVLGQPDLGRQQYIEGHIPGARYVDLNKDASSAMTPSSGRHPLPDPQQLRDKLRDWGVNEDSQIVVYDDVSGSIAGRFWWVLRWLGHSAVAVLDGGLDAWTSEGNALEVREPDPATPGNFVLNCNHALWVSTGEVEQMLGQAESVIVDARPPSRYSGEKESVDGEGGHIPTAVNHPLWGNLDDGGKFLPPEELRSKLKAFSRQTSIHSCGSGVTACHNILAMKIAGFEDTRLYVGSWSEWIRSPKRKRVQGEKPGTV